MARANKKKPATKGRTVSKVIKALNPNGTKKNRRRPDAGRSHGHGSNQVSIPTAESSENRRGRPLAIQDEKAAIELIRQSGKLQATLSETAAFLGVSRQTLDNFFKEHPAAAEAYEDGKENGKMSLRRKQFKLADKSAGMAIFLGKNWLGQEDKWNVKQSGQVEHQHTFMTDLLDQIDEKMRQAERTYVQGLLPAPSPENRG